MNKGLLDYANVFGLPADKLSLREIVPIQGIHKELLTDFTQVVISKQNSASLLFGFPGSGRTTTMRYVVESLKNQKYQVRFISIDVEIFNTESQFTSALCQELEMQGVSMDYDVFGPTKEFLFKDINEILKELPETIILYLQNMHELSKSKRQVLLYSLLDWVRSSAVKIILAGSVNDIMFLESLEKRVKSRLSYNSYYFFNHTFEEVNSCIIKRVELVKNDDYNGVLKKMLQKDEIQEFLRFYYLAQRWFMKLMEIAFCFFESKSTLAPSLPEEFLKGLQFAKKTLEPDILDGHLRELGVSSELLLLILIKRLIQQEVSPIKLDRILEEYETLKKRANIMSSVQFSRKVLSNSLKMLSSLSIIKTEKGNAAELDTSELLLNLPLEQLSTFILDVKSNIPSAFFEWATAF